MSDMTWVKASIERDIQRARNDMAAYRAMADAEPDEAEKSKLLDKVIDLGQFAQRQQRRLDGGAS